MSSSLGAGVPDMASSTSSSFSETVGQLGEDATLGGLFGSVREEGACLFGFGDHGGVVLVRGWLSQG